MYNIRYSNEKFRHEKDSKSVITWNVIRIKGFGFYKVTLTVGSKRN